VDGYVVPLQFTATVDNSDWSEIIELEVDCDRGAAEIVEERRKPPEIYTHPSGQRRNWPGRLGGQELPP
jgi:hypothetical protein